MLKSDIKNKIRWVILLFSLFFSTSCLKTNYEIADASQLSMIAYDEDLWSLPITCKEGFRLITKNSSGMHLTQIDTVGKISYLLHIDPLVPATSSKTKPIDFYLYSSRNGDNFIVFSYDDIVNNSTIPSTSIIKTSAGNVLWQISTANINDVDTLSFNTSSVTSDDGVVVFLQTDNKQLKPGEPAVANYIYAKYFDASGKNTTNNMYDYSIFKDVRLSKIFSLPNDTTFAFFNIGRPNTKVTTYMSLLNRSGKIGLPKLLTDCPTNIENIIKVDDKLIINGTYNANDNIIPPDEKIKVVFINTSGTYISNYLPDYYIYVYSLIKYNQKYIYVGTLSESTNTAIQTNAFWALTDQVSNPTSIFQDGTKSEYINMALAMKQINSNNFIVLGVKANFGVHATILFFKTTINAQ